MNWLNLFIGAVISAAIGSLGALINHLIHQQKAQEARQGAIEDGVVALLYDRICGEYAECKSKGYATVEDMQNMESLYTPYHALGRDGTGTELYDRVKKMPNKPAERKSI